MIFGYLLFQAFNQVVVNKQKLFGNAGPKRVMLKTHIDHAGQKRVMYKT